MQLPFLETPSPIYVEKKVLRDYLPREVAQWMIDHAGIYGPHVKPDPGVIRLPMPHDLPLVFAARLSLSFPVLLSAFPLMTPDFSAKKDDSGLVPLRRLWLSDGGLTSNFPVHFFDSPIPSRPTFCLNLIDYGAATPTDSAAGSGETQRRRTVVRARSNSSRSHRAWPSRLSCGAGGSFDTRHSPASTPASCP